MKAFECKMCGDCCYGEGGIYLVGQEGEKIAHFLGISLEAFVARYSEERNGRIYLKTGDDRFCIFYENGKGCRIHPVKPARCALWPYYPANVTDRETWEMAKWACRGIDRTCSFEEFIRQSQAALKDEETVENPKP